MRSVAIYGFVFSFILVSGAAYGATINVPGDYSSIQLAIEEASDDDLILVDSGTYFENLNFLGKSITLSSHDPYDPSVVAATIIDSSGIWRVVTFEEGESLDSVITGFTIQNGQANDGGGILCLESSPTIVNNVIAGNSANDEPSVGGGICCYGSSALIDSNIIEYNQADRGGGGIYGSDSSVTVINNEIRGNYDYSLGGGIFCEGSSPVIVGNTITDNAATDDGAGGGIGIMNASLVTIEDNVISDNRSTESGGGIWLRSSSCTVKNNVISGNSGAEGAGVYLIGCPGTLANNIITDNDSSWKGGGIYSAGSLFPTIVNNTICNNSVHYSSSMGEI